ncbi:alpha/beta fold hydrolase [Paenibacillus sp. NPDC058071]|uniref:alpha/beta fold hydrolase n=1 Tax=Paenibacillus sp. NPDC058071 TaxID=3346326 RepID=UPI0036DE4B73
MSIVSIADRKMIIDNGLELAYYDSQEAGPEAPVVVLLHGFCGSSSYWEKVVPLLAGRARLLIPDLRGHGRSSSSSEEAYTMEMYASDLADMLSRLEIAEAHLLGHSLGGYITLAFAERYGDRLRSFGLVHSTSLPDSEAAKANRDASAAAIRKDGIEAFIDGLVPKLFAAGHLETMEETVERWKRIGYGTSPAGAVGASLGMKERPDRTEVLKRWNKPLLLLAGEHDQIMPTERTLIADGENVAQVLLSGSGHMAMAEQPNEFAQAVSNFIDKAGE